MIACVDYGLGNLASVRNAFQAAGADVVVTADPDVIRAAEGVVLPGVGSASAGMEGLRSRGLDDVVRGAGMSGRPFLGLCLGMQLLFEGSEEGNVECLGLLPGTVRLLRGDVKVPHIGWNQVAQQSGFSIWSGFDTDPYFYFVHSYICDPDDASVIAGTTEYSGTFCSVVTSGPIWGTQFHPERSGRTGGLLIRNFIASC